MRFRQFLIAASAALGFGAACGYQGTGDSGSQTNWLEVCDSSNDCGRLECICGVCTKRCSDDLECDALPGGRCLGSGDQGAVAACDGDVPSTSMCLPLCDDGTCPDGSSCLAGVCAPAREAMAAVSIDPTVRYQTLIGFGASLAHDEELIVNHPDSDRLFDAMFAESGFDIVRLRNRYERGNTGQLAPAVEIVAAAAARLGRPPTIYLSGGSPPASLKANGTRACSVDDPGCTLVRDAEGQFDYSGFGDHWRASLEAYETVGIQPDFVSIQSNPDSLAATAEACHFLPQEGVGSFTSLDGEVSRRS